MKNTNFRKNQKGVVLVLGLILLVVLTIIGFSSIRTSSTQEKSSANHNWKAISRSAAETGASTISELILKSLTIPSSYSSANQILPNGSRWKIAPPQESSSDGKKYIETTVTGEAIDSLGNIGSTTSIYLKFLIPENATPNVVANGNINIASRTSDLLFYVKNGAVAANASFQSDVTMTRLKMGPIADSPIQKEFILYRLNCTVLAAICPSNSLFKKLDAGFGTFNYDSSLNAEIAGKTVTPTCNENDFAPGTPTNPKIYRCNTSLALTNKSRDINDIVIISNDVLSATFSGKSTGARVKLYAKNAINFSPGSDSLMQLAEFMYTGGNFNFTKGKVEIVGYVSAEGSINFQSGLRELQLNYQGEGATSDQGRPTLIAWSES